MSDSDRSNGHPAVNGQPTIYRDADGPIPTFGPARLDENGRLLPLSDEERKARADAGRRLRALLDSLPDDDPPGAMEEVMRSIDAGRSPGAKKFEGMY